MKSLLTTSQEGLKKEAFLLELEGLIENKTLFQLNEALKLVNGRRIEKVEGNLYNLTSKKEGNHENI